MCGHGCGEFGGDFCEGVVDNDVLGRWNVERNAEPLSENDPLVAQLEEALAAGRRLDGETAEDAGYRQAAKIMDLCNLDSAA